MHERGSKECKTFGPRGHCPIHKRICSLPSTRELPLNEFSTRSSHVKAIVAPDAIIKRIQLQPRIPRRHRCDAYTQHARSDALFNNADHRLHSLNSAGLHCAPHVAVAVLLNPSTVLSCLTCNAGSCNCCAAFSALCIPLAHLHLRQKTEMRHHQECWAATSG